jgi:hypothetical protein
MSLARPIFVVGTMRSGSTLFRLILDAHPRIAISEETGFMRALAATKRIPDWKHGRGWYERIGWTEAEIDARLRDFYSGMFERHALAQGKQRWGEKTPFHSGHIAQMASVFPDSVFVGIVRHPGAVVHSLVRNFRYDSADAAVYWDETNKEILRRGLELGDDRFALLRYEDLVQEPEGTLRELLDWLGESWSDDVLRHNDVQAARGTPRLSVGNTRTRDPITTEAADRWTDGLPDPAQQVLATRTAPLARFFGYDPTRPGTPGPLVAVGDPAGRRRLLTGSALARRQRGPDAVSLDASDHVVVMPETDPAELAKRLQQVESALARVRSRRVVRWSNAVLRAQRRVTGLPGELLSAAGQLKRRTRPVTPRRRWEPTGGGSPPVHRG